VKLLISVRSIDEALVAARHADLVDMKEPNAGALGALPLADIADIVTTLRARHPRLRLSATVGDPHGPAATGPAGDQATAALLDRVIETARCGVDDVKVGLGPADAPWAEALARLATRGLPGGAQIVPVLLADHGVPDRLASVCLALPFAALMLDTQDKSRGSLLLQRSPAELERFVRSVRQHGRQAGLAGSLQIDDLAALRATGCDLAGFRGAVCAVDRRGVLDAGKVEALRRRRDRECWAAAA